jgi:hypothetical protein
MNQESENETDAIRSDIDTTRRRMDDTMDALGDRLKGRHLFDEILGFFRGDSGGRGAEIREKVTRSASTAARSVTDAVKANPVPAILIGAGVAWLIFSNRRDARTSGYDEEEDSSSYDPDFFYDRPLDYPSGDSTPRSSMTEEEFSTGGSPREFGTEGSNLEQVKVGAQDTAQNAAQKVKQKLGNVGSQLREKTHMAGERIRDAGSRVQARTREVYVRAKDRVVTTADQHPLEVGLACLAAGVAVGLALPTPEKVNRVAGPAMDRLRQRTRAAGGDFLEKGKRVVSAAGTAFKNEARQQGLTFERSRERSGEQPSNETSTPGGAQAGQSGSGSMRASETTPSSGAEQRSSENAGGPTNMGRGI